MSTERKAMEAAEALALAHEAGLDVCALSSVRRILGRLDRAAWLPTPKTGTSFLLPALRPALAGPEAGSFLACAFPYVCDRLEDLGGEAAGPSAFGLVAPFARRDYYRAAVKALRRVARRAADRLGRPSSEFRIFVNSRVPEKLIAYGAGLGAYGKNRLLFTPAFGSRFVIGLLFLPVIMEAEGDEPALQTPEEWCGACAACLSACPAAALGALAPLDLTGCLKARSDRLEPWDEGLAHAWGRRFYGCDTCQAVCPANRHPRGVSPVGEGVVGPEVDIAFILSLSDEECRAHFKKTALGLSWILPAALKRNALCVAGNFPAPDLLPAVERYLEDDRPVLADMARRAAAQIRREAARIKTARGGEHGFE